jgi:acetylglutamate kinase
MGDTTAETKARIANALHGADCGCTMTADEVDEDGHYDRLADAVLPIVASLVADNERQAQMLGFAEKALEAARKIAADHEALLVKVNALADEWERDSRDPAFRDTTRALSDHHAWRLRLAVQVDQEEHNDE